MAMGEASGMAGRYAAALFDLARDQGLIDRVLADFATLTAALGASPDLARLVSSPIVSRQDQAKAMAAVGARLGLSDLVAKFIGLIASKRRLSRLAEMIGAFNALVAHHRGQVSAQVTAARTLTDEQIGALKAALKGALRQDVAVDIRIDPALIGGLVVKVGSRMIDSSIRTKLANLKVAMKEVG